MPGGPAGLRQLTPVTRATLYEKQILKRVAGDFQAIF